MPLAAKIVILAGCDLIDLSREVPDFKQNVIKQHRHPERSASLIEHVTERLWRAVEGPVTFLIFLREVPRP